MRPRIPTLTGTFADGARFGAIRGIHAPGHTPGHSIFAYGKIIFVGDLLKIAGGKPRLSPRFMTADAEAARESLSLLRRIDFEWICPAHGAPARRGPAIDAFIAGL